MESIRPALRLLLADRHAPEARALYFELAQYIHRRVESVGGARYGDVLPRAEREDCVGEVLLQLMKGALASFRGESLGELLAFVRSVTDRCVWKAAQRRLRERNTLEGPGGDAVRDWSSALPSPAQVRWVPDSPLSSNDEAYLTKLLQAGSRANFARVHGVSRAAVTQRVQRIRGRIEALEAEQRAAAESWLRYKAREVSREPPGDEAKTE